MSKAVRSKKNKNVNTTVITGLPDEIIKAALPEILAVMTAAAGAFAPAIKGTLRRRIRGRIDKSGLKGTITAPPQGHLVIGGTRAHTIELSKKKAFKFPSGDVRRGEAGQPGRIMHHGAHKRTPFFDQAIDWTASDVERILAKHGDQELDKAAAEVSE